MIAWPAYGALHLDKLEAMTCVCSVGLDMIAAPEYQQDTIYAIIADAGRHRHGQLQNHRHRNSFPPRHEGGRHGGIWRAAGSAPVMPVHPFASRELYPRGGRIPAPMQSLKN